MELIYFAMLTSWLKMKVKVQYLGPVRVRLNKKEEQVEVPGSLSLLSLLQRLCDSYGEWFRKEVLDDDGKNIGKGLVVTVNGIALGQVGGVEAKLKEGDIITLLPFFAGGG